MKTKNKTQEEINKQYCENNEIKTPENKFVM